MKRPQRTKNAIAYVSSGVELDDNKVKTVTIYGNDLTRSFYLAYKGELNDVEDDFVRLHINAGTGSGQ